jgi:hypothetical protein
MGARNSGRTSRMIAEAVKQAMSGKAVYIVFAYAAQANNYKPTISRYENDGLIPKGSIKLESLGSVDIDWVSGRGRGSYPSTVWLYDHFIFESDVRFGNMYLEATRFNAPANDVFVGDNDHGDALPSSKSLMKRIVELETQLAEAKKLNEQIIANINALSCDIINHNSKTQYYFDSGMKYKVEKWSNMALDILNSQIAIN